MSEQVKRINQTIVLCIQELNKQLPPEGRVGSDELTKIVGDGSVLDSLGIVTLFVSIESQMSEQGIECNLMDELLKDHEIHPFATIASLVSWIESRVAHES